MFLIMTCPDCQLVEHTIFVCVHLCRLIPALPNCSIQNHHFPSRKASFINNNKGPPPLHELGWYYYRSFITNFSSINIHTNLLLS